MNQFKIKENRYHNEDRIKRIYSRDFTKRIPIQNESKIFKEMKKLDTKKQQATDYSIEPIVPLKSESDSIESEMCVKIEQNKSQTKIQIIERLKPPKPKSIKDLESKSNVEIEKKSKTTKKEIDQSFALHSKYSPQTVSLSGGKLVKKSRWQSLPSKYGTKMRPIAKFQSEIDKKKQPNSLNKVTLDSSRSRIKPQSFDDQKKSLTQAIKSSEPDVLFSISKVFDRSVESSNTLEETESLQTGITRNRNGRKFFETFFDLFVYILLQMIALIILIWISQWTIFSFTGLRSHTKSEFVFSFHPLLMILALVFILANSKSSVSV